MTVRCTYSTPQDRHPATWRPMDRDQDLPVCDRHLSWIANHIDVERIPEEEE